MCGGFCRCEWDYELECFKIWASSVNSIGRDMCAFCAFIGVHPKTEVDILDGMGCIFYTPISTKIQCWL